MNVVNNLFDVPHERLRAIKEDISRLSLEAARQKINFLKKQYPHHGEVARELDVVLFLEEAFRVPHSPTELFNTFRALVKLFQDINYTPEYFRSLEVRFFEKIIECYRDNPVEPIYGYPPGYLFLKAEKYDQAHESFTREIENPSLPEKKRARFLGYLADLYSVMGDSESARKHYRNAILTDWQGIDKKAIVDEEVSALIQGTYIPEAPGNGWAVSAGHMFMVFPRWEFTNPDDIAAFYKKFTQLRDLKEGEEKEEKAPVLFYYAMIISENEYLFRTLKGLNKMDLRKLMRSQNPPLFRLYTKLSIKTGESENPEPMSE